MSTTTGTYISTLDKALEVYLKDLDKDIKVASSNKNAAGKEYTSAQNQLGNKTCTYIKLKATKELYQNLDQCITLKAHKESELIKANIEAMIEDSKTLQEHLAKLSKTLKNVKMEVYTAKEQACSLVDCCVEKEKHDNNEIYNKLLTIPEFETKLNDIKQKAESAYCMADLTFCAAINVSGIQGFASIDSLVNYSEGLLTTVGELKANVEENCKDLSGSIETTIEERSELVAKAAVSKYMNMDARCEETALCNTWNKAGDKCDKNKDHPKKGKIRLNEICAKFKSEIGDGSSPGDPAKEKLQKKGDAPEF